MKRTAACALAALLLALAPGSGCYQAFAQVVSQRGPSGGGAAIVPLRPLAADVSLGAIGTLGEPVPAIELIGPNPAPNPAAEAPAVQGKPSQAQQEPHPLGRELSALEQTIQPAAQIADLPVSEAKQGGDDLADRLTHSLSISARSSSEDPVPISASFGSVNEGLIPARRDGGAQPPGGVPAAAAGHAGGSGGGKAFKIAAALARTAMAAGAVAGLQHLAAAVFPAVFGLVPLAAAWAVSSGIALLGPGVFARIRLGLRDSSRLAGVKLAQDAFIGAFLGAVVVAAFGLWTGGIAGLASLAPLGAAASTGLAAGLLARRNGGTGGLIDGMLAWISALVLPPLLGVAAAGPLSVGALFGLLALPAMTTITFFLGRIIRSAESGTPFSVPGALQKIRFPSYTWVMTGVAFALFTGYAPVWTNLFFGLWTLLGRSQLVSELFLGSLESSIIWGRPARLFQRPALKWVKDNAFNLIYLALAGWSAATAFAAPVTFLVLAFAPERAAVWTESLLGRLLKKGPPVPSSRPALAPESSEHRPARWPKLNFWLKTALLTAAEVTLGAALIGGGVITWTSLAANLALSAVVAVLPVIFSRQILKLAMRARPTTREQDPEVFAALDRILEAANQGRTGSDLRPMPEVVVASMGGPNAAATGPSPRRAMIVVTEEIKQMLLDPDNARAGLSRLMDVAQAHIEGARSGREAENARKRFRIWRKEIAAFIPGIAAEAGTAQVKEALAGAQPAALRALGLDVMTGVMGHEFLGHEEHRDPWIMAVVGAMTSAIGYAAYRVLWLVSRAKAFFARLMGRARPEPAAAVGGLVTLVRTLAALWAPLMATLMQMSSSRNREAHADDAGARGLGHAGGLALGLGLLVTWRPGPGFAFDGKDLPLLAAQAHIMTINPIDQLGRAGVLPGLESAADPAADGGDDFFFNLFITHPDTFRRVEDLADLDEELEGRTRLGAPIQETRPSGGSALRVSAGNDPREAAGAQAAFNPDLFPSFDQPGLDDRLLPAVRALKDGIEASPDRSRELGHLLRTLQEFIDWGGTVRYAFPKGKARDKDGNIIIRDIPSSFESRVNSIFIHARYLHAHPTLVAALLAMRLQQVYDYMHDRPDTTSESSVRQLRAMDGFLAGQDMAALAGSLRINSEDEIRLFETLVDDRIEVILGFSNLETLFAPAVSASAKLREQLDMLDQEERSLARMKERLASLEGIENQNFTLQERKMAIQARISKLEGDLLIRRARIRIYRPEIIPSLLKHGLDTPLSLPEESALPKEPLELARLTLVPMQRGPWLDDRMARVVAFIRETIERSAPDAPVRQLTFLLDGLEKLRQAGGRLRAGFQASGALAYFEPAQLEAVVGWPFARLPMVLLAAIVIHELSHNADFFGVPLPGETDSDPRPLTRETEYLAFKWEAIWANHFDPKEVAREFLDPKNGHDREYSEKAFNLVYHAVTAYLDGQNSLEAMVSATYTEFFGAHFSGLQTAKQLEQDLRTKKVFPQINRHNQWSLDAEGKKQALKRGEKYPNEEQLERLRRVLALSTAKINLYRRQLAQLRKTIARNEQALPDLAQ